MTLDALVDGMPKRRWRQVFDRFETGTYAHRYA